MTVEQSKILTAETVPAYLKPFLAKELKDVFPPTANSGSSSDGDDAASTQLTATAIQGGNVNYAFCITSSAHPDTKVFIKQAPEFVAIFGPDGFPLTSERMQQEMDVYDEWRQLLGAKASTYLPTIHFFDRSNMVVCMEFFDGFELLDHVLVDPSMSTMVTPECDLKIAEGLGEFMGLTHAKTHCDKLPSDERKQYLVQHYENRAMRDVQLEFVFTKCYKEATDEQRAGLTLTDEFMKEVELLKQQYDGKSVEGHAQNLVLCHGDLHPGSVMVDKSTGTVKVIDPEFTVYGPPGLDVGSLLSGYCLGAIHQAYSDNPDAVQRIVDSARAIWDAYVVGLKAGGMDKDDDAIKAIEIETVGFTVAEVCRTALEFAGGRKWLQFEDSDVKATANKAALILVEKCMIARHQGGIELMFQELVSVAKK